MGLLISLFERPTLPVYALGVIVLGIVIIVLPTTGTWDVPDIGSDLGDTTKGTVVDVQVTDRQATSRGELISERIEVTIDGETVTVERSRLEDDTFSIDVGPGDEVLVTASEGPEGTSYFIADRSRTGALWLLALGFAVVVIVVGGWHGLRSLLALGISFLVIFRFIIPAILAGSNPLIISIVGALIVMGTTLFIAHGVNWKSMVALAGTGASLLLAAVLAGIAIQLAELTGAATDEQVTLQILAAGEIDARGLLLGGMIIGSLGVLDNVTMAQSSAIYELRLANRLLDPRQLFRRGMNIGRDHIASTINTLALAYAGTALPLLIIISAGSEPLGVVVNRDLIATEVIRTLAGSIGIVAAVPITTALAALASDAIHLDPDEHAEPGTTWMPPRDRPDGNGALDGAT